MKCQRVNCELVVPAPLYPTRPLKLTNANEIVRYVCVGRAWADRSGVTKFLRRAVSIPLVWTHID